MPSVITGRLQACITSSESYGKHFGIPKYHTVPYLSWTPLSFLGGWNPLDRVNPVRMYGALIPAIKDGAF